MQQIFLARDRVLAISLSISCNGLGLPFYLHDGWCRLDSASLHLQPAALIEIMLKEKVTLANGVPTIWLGIYEEMKRIL
jgi:fatty-acyl-CoA synthase